MSDYIYIFIYLHTWCAYIYMYIDNITYTQLIAQQIHWGAHRFAESPPRPLVSASCNGRRPTVRRGRNRPILFGGEGWTVLMELSQS